MSDGVVYRWLTEADLKEIVRKETEALRALLAEAHSRLPVGDMKQRIETALAKMEER
jgi:hypothetical protein